MTLDEAESIVMNLITDTRITPTEQLAVQKVMGARCSDAVMLGVLRKDREKLDTLLGQMRVDGCAPCERPEPEHTVDGDEITLYPIVGALHLRVTRMPVARPGKWHETSMAIELWRPRDGANGHGYIFGFQRVHHNLAQDYAERYARQLRSAIEAQPAT